MVSQARRVIGMVTVLGVVVAGAGWAPAAAATEKIDFAPPVMSDFDLGEQARPTAAGDFDGDGDLDVVVVSDYRALSLVAGDADGSFELDSRIEMGRRISTVHVADLDLDDDQDLVALSPYGGHQVFVLLGAPGLAFGVPQLIDVQPEPFLGQVADLDLDGDQDLVVGHSTGDVLTLLENDGSGSFSIATTLGHRVNEVRVADLDVDGTLDLLIYGHPGIGVAYGQGDLAYGALQELDNVHYMGGLTAADLDGDGLLDVGAWSKDSPEFEFWLNLGDREFDQLGSVAIDWFGLYQSPWVIDIDGDGALDLGAWGLAHGGRVFFQHRLGRGDATFGKLRKTPMVGHATGGEIVDLDGDAHLDLLTSTHEGPINVARGHRRSFRDARSFEAIGASTALYVHDVDGDGRLDVIEVGGSRAAMLRNTSG